jgi:hypothetical protein
MRAAVKKPLSSEEQRKTKRAGVRRTNRSTANRRTASGIPARSRVGSPAAAGLADTAALRRREFRAFRDSLPTQLERDTMLTPEWVAECVVEEVECFLSTALPEGFVERLAAKTYHLYPRHAHFHRMLNSAGNRGRENLLMYMRHWTAGWLKRERPALYKKLPWTFGQGQRLPATSSISPQKRVGS